MFREVCTEARDVSYEFRRGLPCTVLGSLHGSIYRGKQVLYRKD